jgi:hypothetical protein
MRKQTKNLEDLRKAIEHLLKEIPKKSVLILRDTEEEELAKIYFEEFEKCHNISPKKYIEYFRMPGFEIQRIPHIAPGIPLEDFKFPEEDPQKNTLFTRLKKLLGIK